MAALTHSAAVAPRMPIRYTGIVNDTTHPSPSFLTVKEVCLKLNLSRHAVYRLIESGELPAHRFGRAVRIDAADLETFIEKARTSRG